MRCKDFLEAYDRQEGGTELPWILSRHLASCADCRREVERLDAALDAWRESELAADADSRAAYLEERVMAAVWLTPRPRRTIGLGQWAMAGALLAFSGVLIPLARSLGGFRGRFGDQLLFPFALVLGTLLAIFGFLFIGSHFDELREALDRREESKTGPVHRH